LLLSEIRKQNPHLVSELDIKRGELAAATHDEIQNWEKEQEIDNDGKILKVKRRRASGTNERLCAEKTINYMDLVNEETGMQIFTLPDKDIIHKAHLLTIPVWNNDKKTVTQADFDKAGIVAQAVGLADLNTIFMGNVKDVLYDATALFIEDNMDFAQKFYNPHEPVSLDEQKMFRNRILDWYNIEQPAYYNGRKLQFEEDLESMHPDAQLAVLRVSSNFDTNVHGFLKFTQNASTKNYSELLEEMHKIISISKTKLIT
jgi:hypothetical protein